MLLGQAAHACPVARRLKPVFEGNGALHGRPERRHRSDWRSNMSGTADKGKGRIKQAIGDLTDDDSLKNEGKVDETSGKVKDAANNAVDKVKDALKKD
jgi:uncharacterized protein YjbJ (UPF0337 family)